MPAFGLIRRAVAASNDKRKPKESEVLVQEPQAAAPPHTQSRRSLTVPQPGKGSQQDHHRLRGRASSSTSLSPSLASTTATGSTRRPHLASKSSSLPSVCEPALTCVHADSIMAKRKSSLGHEARAGTGNGKGRAISPTTTRPPAAPQRSESEDALIRQLNTAGGGENMTMVTRSSGSSPVTPASEPLPAVSGSATPARTETPATRSKLSVQDRLQMATRRAGTPEDARPTLARAIASSDSTASRLLRMSSWLGPRNFAPDASAASATATPASKAASIDADTPGDVPFANSGDVKHLSLSEDVPPSNGKPLEQSCEPDASDLSNRAPSGLTKPCVVPVIRDASAPSTPPSPTAPAPSAPAGWLSYLGYAGKSVTHNTDSSRSAEEQAISSVGPKHISEEAEAPAAVSTGGTIVEETQAATDQPLPEDQASALTKAEADPENLAAPARQVVQPAQASQQAGWTGYAKSWLVPVLPVRLVGTIGAQASMSNVQPSVVDPHGAAADPDDQASSQAVEATRQAVDVPSDQTVNRSSADLARDVATNDSAPAPDGQLPTLHTVSEEDPKSASTALPPNALPIAKPPSLRRSRKGKGAALEALGQPSLVLPTFEDTFERPPRALKRKRDNSASVNEVPEITVAPPSGAVWKVFGAVTSYVRPSPVAPVPAPTSSASKGDTATETSDIEKQYKQLPRLAHKTGPALWQGVRRIVIVGVHGWFPHKNVQILTGTPRSSSFFSSMMGEAILSQFESDHGIGEEQLEKVTYIPLDGEGSIDVRVDKLFKQYLAKPEWISDMRRADAVFFVAHSQGCIVTCHLISRLIMQGHIRTIDNIESVKRCEWAFGPIVLPAHAKAAKAAPDTVVAGPQRLLMLALCGIHQGPFYSMTTSAMLQPYLWFESLATKELFEFQDTSSVVSCDYQRALGVLLDHGVKLLLVASLDDQMVPIYSAAFASASHPLLLRAVFVDSKSNAADDWMTNLIVLCIKIRNAGLDDQGLLSHLSEVTAGGVRGVGHSRPYEDLGAYILAVRYLLATESAALSPPNLQVEPFTVNDAKNSYELPWILRGVMDSPEVQRLFQDEIGVLKETILDWKPATKALRDIKQKLEPMAGRAALRNRASRLLKSPSSASLASSNGGGRKEGSEGKQTPVGSPLGVDLKKGAAIGLGHDW